MTCPAATLNIRYSSRGGRQRAAGIDNDRDYSHHLARQDHQDALSTTATTKQESGIIAVVVTAASLSENAVGPLLLDQAKSTYPTITKAWVDTGFKNKFIEHGATLGVDVEVVSRDAEKRGFHVVKRRWIVERSLGWLMTHRIRKRYKPNALSDERAQSLASRVTVFVGQSLSGSRTALPRPRLIAVTVAGGHRPTTFRNCR